MSIYTDPKYRIKRNATQQEQMQYLIQELKIFQSYSQIIMLSAVIGYNNKLFIPIESPASDGVLMQFFTQRDYDMIDFIAYAHKKEQIVLKKNEKYEILENYANGGFDLLVNKLGIDFVDKKSNDRITILNKLYMNLLMNGFKL
ncbi:MAG: hypothetical protein K2K48_02010 [Anaeroplasmataceae bacterium]|nr:hypothetical protein [Anaeroplasmataceae bacterium]MDE6414166.1 hypothetical protein [Anaeroplasmataceae bacterium]